MREIKFRGKSVESGKWVHGHYGTSVEIGDNGGVEHMYRETCVKLHYIVLGDDSKSEIVFPETVGQYTGLKDKNGTPIYEGDIIDIHQTVNGCDLFEVVWDKIRWSAKYAVDMVKPRLYEYDLEELFDVNYNEKYPYEITIEVIGNIHEGVKND